MQTDLLVHICLNMLLSGLEVYWHIPVVLGSIQPMNNMYTG